MTTPATPRTAAGRAYHDRIANAGSHNYEPCPLTLTILAIEAEAAAAPSDALLAALRALVDNAGNYSVPGFVAAIEQARALLRDLRPKEEGQ